MGTQPYLKEIATALYAVLHVFGNREVVDYQHQIILKFILKSNEDQQLRADLTFFYPADDAIGAADCARCEVTLTSDQTIPGFEELVHQVCEGVEKVADYRIFSRSNDPSVTVLQLCERLDNRHWHEETFLLDVAEIINRNVEGQF